MHIPDPRTWFRERGRILLIDRGRVGCPAGGDVDVERCFTCGHLLEMTEGSRARVSCDYLPEGSLGVLARRSG